MFICALVNAQNFPQVNNYTNVYTRKGTAVQGIVYFPLSSSDYAAASNYIQQNYPNATIVENPTSQYNCYSFAFHLSEGNTQKVWINPNTTSSAANLSNYWTDGSFIQVCNEADGDKAHYYAGDHAAVTTSSVSGKYESKWGANCRVLHAPTYCPYDPGNYRRQYYASTKVTGSTSSLCTGTRTFSVKNITGATYTWTYSASVTPVGATNASSFTIQRNGTSNGAAWAQVQISTTCSGTPVTSRIDFTVGSPQTSGYYTIWSDYHNQAIQHPLGDGNSYFIPANKNAELNMFITNPDVTSATWTPSGYIPWTYSYFNSGKKITFAMVSGPSAYNSRTVTWTGPVTTTCGTYTKSIAFTVVTQGSSGFMIEASPNPASTNMTVSTTDEAPELKALSADATVAMELYEAGTSIILKQWRFKNNQKQFTLNVSGLRKGNYILSVTKGKYKQSKQIIISQ